MSKRMRIILLGLMIWVITFIAGFFAFSIFDVEEGGSIVLLWTGAIKALALGIGLALALFLVYRDMKQNYIRTAWEAGIVWYVILLLADLIVLIGLFDLELNLWFPMILSNFVVAIVTVVVGYLLAGSKTNFDT